MESRGHDKISDTKKARTVYIRRIFGDIPAKSTAYTPCIHGSGQPYKYSVYDSHAGVRGHLETYNCIGSSQEQSAFRNSSQNAIQL
jgi:hypothetical protein